MTNPLTIEAPPAEDRDYAFQAGLSKEKQDELRTLLENNLYLFAKVVCGYSDLEPLVHMDMCKHAQDDDSKIKVTYAARGHLKTSTVTEADSLRRICIDPTITILLISESGINAAGMLANIKQILYNSPWIRLLWPHIIPKSEHRDGGTSSLRTPQNKDKEGTIDAEGITSKIVSRHYRMIKCDDLISEEAMNSPSVMRKTNEAVNRLVSLLVMPSDPIHITGTRWAFTDTYSHAEKRFGRRPDYAKYNMPPVVKMKDSGEYRPIWHQRFTMEFFQDIIETDPDQWARQYANNPRDVTLADFKPQWLRYFSVTPSRSVRFRDISSDTLHAIDFNAMRFYIHVDPAVGLKKENDYTAITVVGVAPGDLKFVFEAWQDRVEIHDIIDQILHFARVYSPREISVETVAAQAYIVPLIEKAARAAGEYYRIEPFLPGSAKSKPQRLLTTLQPEFEARRILFRQFQQEIVDEYLFFGRSGDDHLLDTLAQGTTRWQTPVHGAKRERQKALRAAQEAREPRGVTGYGFDLS